MTAAVLRIGRWLVEAHPDETRALLADRRGAEECACEACWRYREARDRAWAVPERPLLEALGLDVGRSFEVTHWSEVAPGEHLYTVDFELVGRVVEGSEPLALASSTWTVVDEPLGNGRRVSVSAWEPSSRHLPQRAPVRLHLCIDVIVPWD